MTEAAFSNDGHYHAFILDKVVPVINTSGQEIIVDASDTTAYAVQTVGYNDYYIEGFTLRGGTQAVVKMGSYTELRDCNIVSPSGGPTVGVATTAYPTIRGCTFSMTGGSGIQDTCVAGNNVYIGTIEDCHLTLADGVGIYVYNNTYTDLTVQDCDVTMENGVGVLVQDGNADISRVKAVVSGTEDDNKGIVYLDSNACEISDCFVSVPDSYGGIGIYAPVNGAITRCTVDGAYYGVWYAISATYSIVTDAVGCGFVTGLSSHAAQYCITDLVGGFSPVAGTGSVVEDPLYCDAANGEYTLRVDSYGNPENHPGGNLIGAYPVACIYGTLTRTCAYSRGDGFGHPGTLVMTDDVTVDAGDTLSLSHANVLVRKASPTLIFEVDGRLDIHGRAVTFESAEESPAEGDWNALYLTDGSVGLLDSVTVRHATYGIYTDSPDTMELTNGVLRDNEITDITPYGFDGDHYGLVENMTIAVGGGTGILFTGDASGLTLTGNTLYGSSVSTRGIQILGTSPTVEGNAFYGFTGGEGIYMDLCTVTLTGNTVESSVYGMRANRGTISIGTTASDSDNILYANSQGIRCEHCDPVIRNNQIYYNGVGVWAGSYALPDLGNQSEDGNNSIFSNGYYCVQNLNQSTVPANGNWWGSASPPPCTYGAVDTSDPLDSEPAGVEAAIARMDSKATGLRILPAHPNPTRAGSFIAFDLEGGAGTVGVHVYDLAGRLVRSFDPGDLSRGRHEILWDGRDGAGRQVGNGIYFVRVATSHGPRGTGKVLVVR